MIKLWPHRGEWSETRKLNQGTILICRFHTTIGACITYLINSSSPKGGCNNPLNSFRPVPKNAQPRGKIAPGTFKGVLHPRSVFGLFLHFSQKLQHIGNK